MERLIVRGVDLTRLFDVPYAANRHPGTTSVDEFLLNPQLGANCQLFALGVLRKAGLYIDDRIPMDQGGRLGSKELWLDMKYTKLMIAGYGCPEVLWELFLMGELRVFDIYFFLPPGIDLCGKDLGLDEDLFKKFHIAIFTGFDFAGHDLGSGPQRAFLHNAKPGPSSLWSIKDFKEKGYKMFGVKRPIHRMPC